MTTTGTRALAGGLFAMYIGAVWAANVATTRYGFVPVAPGLAAPAGTMLIGAVLMIRDFMEDAARLALGGRWRGRAAVAAAIAAGAAASYFGGSSARIAVASGVTFIAAESLEFAVYSPLRRRAGWGTRRWAGLVGAANAAGMAADSLLFLTLAGFGLAPVTVAGQLVGKAWATLAAVAAVVTVAAVWRPAGQVTA